MPAQDPSSKSHWPEAFQASKISRLAGASSDPWLLLSLTGLGKRERKRTYLGVLSDKQSSSVAQEGNRHLRRWDERDS